MGQCFGVKEVMLMPTIKERVQALEQENIARKKAEELLTISVQALASKEAFEALQEKVETYQKKNERIFENIESQFKVTSKWYADLQDQITNLDGNVVGLQVEMRQSVKELDGKIVALDGKVVGLQVEMRQSIKELDGRITNLEGKVDGLQATQTEQTGLLQQILARLPERL